MTGALAPTPFTADEIRAGCPVGRSVTVRMSGDQDLTTKWRSTFLECDDEGAVVETRMVPGEWERPRPPSEARVTWEELRMHAAFPAEATEITEETIETPLGALECLRYEVSAPEGLRILWFAKALPGQPVRIGTVVNGEIEVSSEIVHDTAWPSD